METLTVPKATSTIQGTPALEFIDCSGLSYIKIFEK